MDAVLIVDDNPADRVLFRTILERAGFAVHETARGDEALAVARRLRPHAVVLDVNLPGTDGYTVCRQFRADPLLMGTAVLMLTVLGDQNDILAGLEAGADDYVAKDAPPPAIVARLRRLIQHRRMASLAALNAQLVQVGRLLAGVVHEIRGPLSVIRGSAEILRGQLPTEDSGQLLIDPIIRGSRLLQVRLEHLMAAARGGASALREIDLEPVLVEAAHLFRMGIDPREGPLAIDVQVEQPAPTVLGDSGRIIQVILNLLGNAREAIRGVDRVPSIQIRTRAFDGHAAGGRTLAGASSAGEANLPGVLIEVIDNGPGIDPDHLGRLFEPFFTTKETGTGYGLYLAAEIVHEHLGSIHASNRPEGGACIAIWLPATSAAAVEKAAGERFSEV